MVQHPNFYFFDVGVYRTIRPKGLLDSPEEIDGAALKVKRLNRFDRKDLRELKAFKSD